MAQKMTLDFGLQSPTTIFKRKFRWLFKINGVSAMGIDALPPQRGARPNFSFKEIEVQHLTETFYFPGKPDWKTMNLVLYDIKCRQNPVFEWLQELYDPQQGAYGFVIEGGESFKQEATLELYNGCGDCIEKWRYENVWPQTVDFQDLDMGSSDVVLVDLTLRYDRAYIIRC